MIPTLHPRMPYSFQKDTHKGMLRTIRNEVASLPWKSIMQRLPPLLLIGIFPFAFFGPMYAPFSFAAYILILHAFFLANNARSAFACFVAYTKARESSTTDWYAKYCQETGVTDGSDPRHDMPFDQITHIIILPNYKEEMDTLCETLDVLASHRLALSQYKICLAMEESESGAADKAQRLLNMYADSFYEITYTIHPAGRPGEIRGKSSNVAWAAMQMALRGGSRHEHEILTVMDADTCFAEDYFASVTYHYAVASPSQRRIMMFAPCTVFDRNAKNVPVFVRVTDIFWSVGVISNLYESSPVKIPCSAYSVSMDLALAVNFWDAGPEAIGEDMHMYLKCFFCTKGKVIVKSIFSPASQCNVEGSGSGISGYVSGIQARYTQAKRHLWGSLDTGYVLRSALLTILAPESQQKNAVLLKSSVNKFGKDDKPADSFRWGRLFTLFHRMFEAHVFMGQFMPLLIITSLIVPVAGNALYMPFAEMIWGRFAPADVHPIVSWVLSATSWLRIGCTVFTVTTIYFYEKYHQWVGFDRWALQDTSAILRTSSTALANANRFDSAADLSYEASLEATAMDAMLKPEGPFLAYEKVQYLGKRPVLASARTYPRYMFDWFMIPISGFMFFMIPVLAAQLSHLFTDRLDYKVAAKPVLNRLPQHKSAVNDNVTSVMLSSNTVHETKSIPSLHTVCVHADGNLAVDGKVLRAADECVSLSSSKGDEGYFEEFEDPQHPNQSLQVSSANSSNPMYHQSLISATV